VAASLMPDMYQPVLAWLEASEEASSEEASEEASEGGK